MPAGAALWWFLELLKPEQTHKPDLVPARPKQDKILCRGRRHPEFLEVTDQDLTGITGGHHIGKRVIITGQNTITQTLRVVAEDDLIVDDGAVIRVVDQAPGTRPIDITLLSLSGDVVVRETAQIKGGNAASGPEHRDAGQDSVAVGLPGWYAGFIKLGGVNVRIDGTIEANAGGDGGAAEATGQAGPANTGGSALAIGGHAGDGGDVLLFACERIVLSGTAQAQAGKGGSGGHYVDAGIAPPMASEAHAAADNAQVAIAIGGNAGFGGDVAFVGVGAQRCRVQVAQGAFVTGGATWLGGHADAHGGDAVLAGSGAGGYGLALGGRGGVGGTVRFVRCDVTSSGTIKSGDGGGGGVAWALGGAGESTAAGGKNGGSGFAKGGDGSAAGRVPRWTTPGGLDKRGTRGATGRGGDAKATGGTGGFNTGAGAQLGGSSGASEAEGGANGMGQPATPDSAPATAATDTSGATGTEVPSAGRP